MLKPNSRLSGLSSSRPRGSNFADVNDDIPRSFRTKVSFDLNTQFSNTPREMNNGVISPMCFDFTAVPCWNEHESSVMTSENVHYSSSSHKQRDIGKTSFLPGLLNSNRLENKLHSGSRHNNKDQNNNMFLGNANKLFDSTSTSKSKVQHNANTDGNRYQRNISTAAPSLPSAHYNSQMKEKLAMEPLFNHPAVSSTDIPVDPHVNRMMDKYNYRPVSRTSSRISRAEMMQIRGSSNSEMLREDLLRVKSLGRFSKL